MSRKLDILDWASLDETRRREVLRRPAQREAASVLERAGRIVADVRARGDAALAEYTERLDRVRLESFAVTRRGIRRGRDRVDGGTTRRAAPGHRQW